MQQPSVAIVVLNYNTAKLLQQFLPSIVATTYKNKRIIVADNGSKDNSKQIVESFAEVEWIPLGNNYGYAEGYNRALAKIDTDYFVLLNSDVEVTLQWIDSLVDYVVQNPTTAALQPKILSQENKTKFEYAGAAGGFMDVLGYPYCRGRIFNECEEDKGQYDQAVEVFWASGAALFIKASVYNALGGLDNRLFAHMEEIDLCWRIHLAGYKVACQPKSVVYHVGGGTLSAQNAKKTYLNFRNSLVLLARYEKGPQKYGKLLLRMVLDAPAALFFLLKGRPADVWAIVKAHWNFILNYGYWVKENTSLKNKTQHKIENPKIKSIIYQYYIKKVSRYSEL